MCRGDHRELAVHPRAIEVAHDLEGAEAGLEALGEVAQGGSRRGIRELDLDAFSKRAPGSWISLGSGRG